MSKRLKLDKLYPVGTFIKIGRRSFEVKGFKAYHISYNDKINRFTARRPAGYRYEPILSRPYVDGVMQKAGSIMEEEWCIIYHGWADCIIDGQVANFKEK